MNWIDLEDKLPDFETPILLTGEGHIKIARLYMVSSTLDSVSLYFYEGASGFDDILFTATHYMPLPPLPPKKS